MCTILLEIRPGWKNSPIPCFLLVSFILEHLDLTTSKISKYTLPTLKAILKIIIMHSGLVEVIVDSCWDVRVAAVREV